MSETTLNTGTLPTVRANQAIIYNLETSGTLEFNQELNEEALKFLNHGRQNVLIRKVRPYDAEFKKHLEADGFDVEDLLAILGLIDRINRKGVAFKTKKRLSRHEIRQATRGLDVLAELSVFGKDFKVEYGYLQFRVTENEVKKVKFDNGRFFETKGWLVPVWSEESRPVQY